MAGGSERHWPKVWLAAAACARFAAGAAEPDVPDTDWTAITEPLLSSIEDEEARNGPFSRALVELLTSLGLAYQENGEHVLAASVLDRALSLKRVNDGLFGLEQVPLVERLIDSERAIGRTDTAEDLESRLLDLARRNYHDPRAAPIFREAAERRLELYERFLRGELTPALSINGSPGTQDSALLELHGARQHYNEAIGVLAANAPEYRTELEDLEEALTRSYYLEASDRRRARRRTSLSYNLHSMGLASYERRIGLYAAAGYTNVVDYAQRLVELADWSLLFSHNGRYGQPRKVTIVAAAGEGAVDAAADLTSVLSHGRFRPSPLPDAGRSTAYRLRYSLAAGGVTPRL